MGPRGGRVGGGLGKVRRAQRRSFGTVPAPARAPLRENEAWLEGRGTRPSRIDMGMSVSG